MMAEAFLGSAAPLPTPMAVEAPGVQPMLPPVTSVPPAAPPVVNPVAAPSPAQPFSGAPALPPAPEVADASRPDSYPKALCCDFSKLEPASLLKYLEHHGLTAKPDATLADLAILVGRHFEKEAVDEDGVLHTFLMSGVAAANNLAKLDKKRKRPGAGGVGGGGGGGAAHHTFPAATLHGAGSTFASRKEQRMAYSQLAKVDEEVAARLLTQAVSDDHTTGWILARVVKYVADRDQYHVRDEDDHANVQAVPSGNVIRLEDSVLDVQKNDTVLAVFPNTTTFYRAIVTKVPKRMTAGGPSMEMVVKFEDDEDETGRTPLRRVPARHVLRLSQVGRFDVGSMQHDTYSDGGSGADRGARKSMKEYKAMISHALQKLPANKGTLKEIFRIIEEDFRDELCWRLEGDTKKTPVWKNQVRKLLLDPRSGYMFINSGDRAYYSESGYAEH